MYEKMHTIRVGPQQLEKCWYYASFKKGKKEDQDSEPG